MAPPLLYRHSSRATGGPTHDTLGVPSNGLIGENLVTRRVSARIPEIRNSRRAQSGSDFRRPPRHMRPTRAPTTGVSYYGDIGSRSAPESKGPEFGQKAPTQPVLRSPSAASMRRIFGIRTYGAYRRRVLGSVSTSLFSADRCAVSIMYNTGRPWRIPGSGKWKSTSVGDFPSPPSIARKFTHGICWIYSSVWAAPIDQRSPGIKLPNGNYRKRGRPVTKMGMYISGMRKDPAPPKVQPL